MKKTFLASAVIAATLLVSFATKDAGNQYASVYHTNLIEPDSVFVKVAASSNMMEVALGNMAQQKATNQRVKAFGAMMVQEHTKALQELTTLAASKKFTVPTDMIPKHKRQVDFLTGLSGTEFDQMYTRVMVEEHNEDVDEFEDASKKAADADLKAWAGRMLPHLKMHRDTARQLRAFVRNNYSNMAGGTGTGTTMSDTGTHAGHDNMNANTNTTTNQSNMNNTNTNTQQSNKTKDNKTKTQKGNKTTNSGGGNNQ